MSDFISTLNVQHTARLATRMSYTSNGKQSVLCTLVASDPYFFDVDPQALEDEMDATLSLDGARFELPESLQAARDTSDGFVTLGDDSDGLLLTDDLASLCRNALVSAQAGNIDDAVALLDFSSTARVLLHNAQAAGFRFVTDAATPVLDIDVKARTARINPFISTSETALLIARASREFALSDIHPGLCHPDRAVLVNRALNAEYAGIMIQVAWELSLAGEKGAWESISRSALADQAYAFGQRASSDFRALRDGRAAIAAFDQWFYSGRTRKADRALIQGMLAATNAQKEPAILYTIGETVNALRSIGDRGIGRNFLLDHMMTLLEDGFYGEVRDRSNANFLWFVKFERSYRAAEEVVEAKKQQADSDTIGTVLSFPSIAKKATRRSRKAKAEASIVMIETRRTS